MNRVDVADSGKNVNKNVFKSALVKQTSLSRGRLQSSVPDFSLYPVSFDDLQKTSVSPVDRSEYKTSLSPAVPKRIRDFFRINSSRTSPVTSNRIYPKNPINVYRSSAYSFFLSVLLFSSFVGFFFSFPNNVVKSSAKAVPTAYGCGTFSRTLLGAFMTAKRSRFYFIFLFCLPVPGTRPNAYSEPFARRPYFITSALTQCAAASA